jgi:hypothetical protein
MSRLTNLGDDHTRLFEGGRTIAGFLMDVKVLLEGVESVKVVMKFPRAKFASDAGITRCMEISYGWLGARIGNDISAYGGVPSPYCRYRGDSHPTATFFQTYQPEKREKSMITGISARHTNNGIS